MKNFFYIHNAKCAGTSLWAVLLKLTNNKCYRNSSNDLESPIKNGSVPWHLSIDDINVNIFEKYTTITSIRHPVSRFFSIYNFLLERCVNDRNKKDIRDFSIDTFLKYDDVYQYKYFGPTLNKAIQAISKIDYILDVDTLDSDMSFFINKEGLNPITIPRKNICSYWIKSFSVEDIIKITKALNEDILFYNKALEIKLEKMNGV